MAAYPVSVCGYTRAKGEGGVCGDSNINGARTERELDAGDVLLDGLQLDGILVGELDIPEGVLLGLGTGGRAFYTFAAHGGMW